MSNSKLIDYVCLSPNCNKPRVSKIDTITIHHMAGNSSVEECGNRFAKSATGVSSNYAIGSDGRIALYVDEGNRSWCSSSPANDHRAITIEVANDTIGGNWHVSDKALKSLIELVADICKRNGIKKLVWSDSSSDRINHKNGCNMTVHRDFSATACPGPYLMSKMSYIASECNKKLTASTIVYRVRKTWSDESSQLGAFNSLDNAKKACKSGYSVFDDKGKAVYTVPASQVDKFAKGAKVILSGAKLYASSSAKTHSSVKSGTFYIYDGKATNSRYRITTAKENCEKTPVGNYVTGWVNKSDIS